MSRTLKLLSALIAIVLAGFISSCSEDDPPLADNLVNFEAAELGFDTDSVSITLSLSRAEEIDVPVTITLTTDRVTYSSEYITSPSAETGTLSLTIPAGSTTTSFTVTKLEDASLNGDESITFNITTAGEPVVIGTTASLKLNFSAITSTGATMKLLGGGGSPAPNSVYVDFSSNKQTSVDRISWDLGFYCGSEFVVHLDYASNGAAKATDKNDITQVGLSDATGVSLAVSAENTIGLVDNYSWTNELDSTVISEISSTDSENLVYLYRPQYADNADPSTWYKIRILRNGSTGYTLQYAKLGETTISTIDVEKNDEYNFQFVSFETGLVSVEPRAASWDVVWTYAMYYTAGTYAYAFSDLVFTNSLDGTQAVIVTATDELTYNSFAEADLDGLDFSDAHDSIGAKWRATTGSTTGIYTYLFYIIKDSAGNYYKLKFVSMGLNNDGGTRGEPEIQYALVKAAE